MRRYLSVFLILCLLFFMAGCDITAGEAAPEVRWAALEKTGALELRYATGFSVDYYTGGYCLVTISGGDAYLLVPENAPVPGGLPEGTAVLQQPLSRIYLVSTSVMDLFRSLGRLDAIAYSGTNAAGWYIPEAKAAMESGEILFAGKYSAPDYEALLSGGCDLAIENTMILHSPETREKLEELGIPVLVERSSYEPEPLGRMEWIKLYGVLLGMEQEAASLYDRQLETVEALMDQPSTGKTVAFFYITGNGAANVRKSGDYVSKMIEAAGGSYIFSDLGDSTALSTMTMDMETFYAGARDADYIIYNSTIDGELSTLEEFFDKSPLLKDFRAARTGHVYCTSKNMFQESMGLSDFILDVNRILTEENTDDASLHYLHKLS